MNEKMRLGFFSEKEQEQQKVELEVDTQRYILFKGALAVLNQNERQAFEDFIAYTITQANRKLSNDTAEPKIFDDEESNHLSEETIRNRIYKWARKENGYPHLMVKAFFMASGVVNNNDELFAWRSKMQVCFNEISSSELSDNRFISMFRQMCSDSSRAYGNIFIYNGSQEKVYINEKYKDLILELKDQFSY